MIWRALSRLIAVRLLLLAAIASAGPAGIASSWHSPGSLEHRLPLHADARRPASLHAGALPPTVATHCAACQFGATSRAWAAPATASSLTPASRDTGYVASRVTALREPPADANAGRAPPRVA